MREGPPIGEVWMVDFGYDGKLRAAMVISVPDPNCRLAVASVVQVTTRYLGSPFEVTLPRVPWLREQSYCNAQSIQPVQWREFTRKLGRFEAPVVKEVQKALARWLGV
jgi:mRNA interferase MazF